jgi:hypothetical protein
LTVVSVLSPLYISFTYHILIFVLHSCLWILTSLEWVEGEEKEVLKKEEEMTDEKWGEVFAF